MRMPTKVTFARLAIAAIVCGIGLLLASTMRNESVGSRLASKVASEESSFDFSEETLFPWDRMFVFDCYTIRTTVDKTLGFEWSGYNDTSIESSDSVLLVVFVKDGKVVYWYEQPRAIELGWIVKVDGYPKTDAKFQIVRTADGRAELKPH